MHRSDRSRTSAVPPLLLTPEQTADALGVGRTYVYALIRDRRLRSVTIGRSRRIPYTSLLAYVTHLEQLSADSA